MVLARSDQHDPVMVHDLIRNIAGWRAELVYETDSRTVVGWALTPPWTDTPLLTFPGNVLEVEQAIALANLVRSTSSGMVLHEVWLRIRSHTWSSTVPEFCSACHLGALDPLSMCPGVQTD